MNKRKGAKTFVLVTVALDVLAIGIVIPVWPSLVKHFTAYNSASASIALGIISVIWAVAQFFAAPVLGVLSDRIGRRPVILLSNFGLALDYLIMAIAPSMVWIFVGRVLSGITSASVPTANAYIADVTPPDKRAGAFGAIGAAFGLGFVIGPALGGFLGNINFRLPFWVAGALGLLNLCYGLFVMPESLKPENRKANFDWSRANPVGSLRLLRSHRAIFGMATVAFIGFIAQDVYALIYVLYGQYRYGWVGSSRVDLQACKLEYSIVSPK